ncbi:galactan 5-O-arabinofuranosyltransferase [Corynebacterium minutissimum]|uniref:Galactan 5-O-arabinofuranosyltransferase n=1 Tax=Corynebacterium minutissimum TaxID=38301 RepID=A0A2X4RFV9_9CORY|nr:galactan 5-O-arabinofuranosyltransferase [Corynebacterium minutissimum]KHO30512.1 membrane protein [Corynebacterium minutissimum]QPS60073.1 galactan 5-O-arabinofuranosyltransferase [Corynebacterium minutissimum]QQA79137.1 galactan 5-O-arabinofuranosyltransferase [Corynebacterium minutissimum]SQI01116.1 arabinofuranosyl transferase A [Corynebacterium minutissimum]VEG04817.1 arabinofuranosyl transferase A [Corynebacterium minutissimum]
MTESPAMSPAMEYDADRLSRRASLVGIAAAALGGGLITLLGFFAFKTVSLPAFSTSMVTRALSTTGTVLTVGLVGALCVWWLFDEHNGTQRPRWRSWLTIALCYISPALLTLATIGLPLSASRLWLDGVQVDQVFRTQFLTRATEASSYADMNYEGLPTFYPLGWFWMGGRLANLLNMPGWEVYQPWALISLAVAGCILVPLWQRLVSSLPVATAIALTTTAVTLTLGAEEPYSAVLAMGVPAVALLCSRAFDGSWFATLAIALYLGISACFYTLYTGAVSLTIVTLIALVIGVSERTWTPFVHLAAIAVGSLAIAAIAWAPYIAGVLQATSPLESAAQHYLPEEGTQIPAPFLSLSVIGMLSLIGLVYLVLRIDEPDLRSLSTALVGTYLWTVASMVMTLAGHTLLGFRLEIVVVLLFATAGILALADFRLMGLPSLYPAHMIGTTSKRVTVAFAIILGMGGVYYAQQIPATNESALDHAYTDTDGYGERADRYTSDSAADYGKIREFIDTQGHAANDTVVLTDEKLFMAYNPYYGFNAFTSHYANPLGEFTTRNLQIEDWAKGSWEQSPEEFAASLDSSPWRAPDVLIFRGDVEEPGDGYKTHLAEDIYPNQPNVRYRAVFFNPEVFEKGWETTQIGPFVVAART